MLRVLNLFVFTVLLGCSDPQDFSDKLSQVQTAEEEQQLFSEICTKYPTVEVRLYDQQGNRLALFPNPETTIQATHTIEIFDLRPTPIRHRLIEPTNLYLLLGE